MFLQLLIASLIANPLADSARWSGFRGDGTSVSSASSVPVHWGPTQNVAWRTELPGYGQSSPVVWNDQLYVTAIDGPDKQTCIVVNIDPATGKPRWKKSLPASQKGKNNPMMSRAAGTPVVDRDGIYAFFESGDLWAFSHAGDELWSFSLTKEFGELKNNHGLGSSPIATHDSVIILVDHLGPSYLVAFDKSTGKVRWKTERPSRTSWTSPVLGTRDGRSVIYVSSNGTLTAYDAETGKQRAQLEGLVGNNIPSPTVAGEYVVVGAGENRMNNDPVASARSNCVVRLEQKEGNEFFNTVWTGKKVISHHASPVVYHDHVYFVTKAGVVHCMDLKSGEVRFAERLESPCWATPIAVGDLVYFFGKDGTTTVLRSGPKYEKVAANRLWSAKDYADRLGEAKKQAAESMAKLEKEKAPGKKNPDGRGSLSAIPKEELEAIRFSAVGDVVYGAAVVNASLFVRTGNELFCIRASHSKTTDPR